MTGLFRFCIKQLKISHILHFYRTTLRRRNDLPNKLTWPVLQNSVNLRFSMINLRYFQKTKIHWTTCTVLLFVPVLRLTFFSLAFFFHFKWPYNMRILSNPSGVDVGFFTGFLLKEKVLRRAVADFVLQENWILHIPSSFQCRQTILFHISRYRWENIIIFGQEHNLFTWNHICNVPWCKPKRTFC